MGLGGLTVRLKPQEAGVWAVVWDQMCHDQAQGVRLSRKEKKRKEKKPLDKGTADEALPDPVACQV